MIGAELNVQSLTWKNYKSFEDLERPVSDKNKILSVIASIKSATKGHVARSRFIEMLAHELGDVLDVYGLGRIPVVDKWQAIAPYRYHLAIENCTIPDYWTEKLSDAFIGEAFPIYSGCTNIGDYFPSDAFEIINIDQPEDALNKIRHIISSDLWCKRHEAISEAKRRVLYEHNLFCLLSTFLKNNYRAPERKVLLTLRPEEDIANRHTLAGVLWKKLSRLKNVMRTR